MASVTGKCHSAFRISSGSILDFLLKSAIFRLGSAILSLLICLRLHAPLQRTYRNPQFDERLVAVEQSISAPPTELCFPERHPKQPEIANLIDQTWIG